MYNKIKRKKLLLAFILVIVLFLFQVFAFGKLIQPRIEQFTLLSFIILLGIYSFKGFELDTIKSLNASFVSYLVGAIVGGLGFSLIIVIFYRTSAVTRWEIITTTLFAGLILPFLVKGYYKIIQKAVPSSMCYAVGEKNKYAAIIEEIIRASHGKLMIADWVEKEGDIEKIPEAKKNGNFILIVDYKLFRQMKEKLLQCEKNGYQKVFITSLVEKWLRRIPMELIDEYSDYYEPLFSDVSSNRGERIFDVVLAIIIGIVLFPVALLVMFLILLTSGLPVIFSHERVGKNEKPFLFYKFRSLKNERNHVIDSMVNPNGTIELRATLLGRVIRKLRLDEIPQLINILKGTMSLVGPRPEMVTYHKQYKEQIPFYEYRAVINPGITGWAQIHYNHTSTLEEYKRKTEYDLYYIKNKNILLDIQIILMTLETMIGMRGSR